MPSGEGLESCLMDWLSGAVLMAFFQGSTCDQSTFACPFGTVGDTVLAWLEVDVLEVGKRRPVAIVAS